ncbi:hypothetical protein SAMN04487995_3155 [Dyadobacter koreensis]|uniref:Uncharacterized protein n=1 Tax=Dyadobacter koreensis TaxID=408657 RepID=A0A1H6W0G9_9BACT|nr:hypothetical protein [Dyadobacter koreensis]SEJ08794.1 hypothetical protein SAMN04487995_3155 [Dyadobacter koreensis]
MKRLSLEELKAQKAEQLKEGLEAIRGGNEADCHSGLSWWEALLYLTPFHR